MIENLAQIRRFFIPIKVIRNVKTNEKGINISNTWYWERCLHLKIEPFPLFMNIFASLEENYVQRSIFFQVMVEIDKKQFPYFAKTNRRCIVGSWSFCEKLPYSEITPYLHIFSQIWSLYTQFYLSFLHKVQI